MKIGYYVNPSSTYGLRKHFQDEIMEGVGSTGTLVDPTCFTGASGFSVETAQGWDSFFFINWLHEAVQQLLASHGTILFNYLIDAPFHHNHWIKNSPNSVLYGVVDPSHVELLALFGRKGVFLPHGGSLHPVRPWELKDIDILFPGSRSNPDIWLRQIDGLPGRQPEFVHRIINSYFSTPGVALFLHLFSLLRTLGEQLDLETTFTLLRLADHYIRAKSRMDLLKAFWNFPVVIVGEGWGDVPLSPHHQWMREVPLSHIGELMSRAKIVLCPNNGFVQGAHERILTAMGSGAVALTVPSTFLREHFSHGQHLAFFTDVQEAAELGGQILLGSHWENVGHMGHDAVASRHSWFHRGRELVEVLHKKQGAYVGITPVEAVIAS